VKGFRIIAQTRAPDGALLALHEHDGEFYLKLNGRQLMSTIATTSEIMLAELACKGLAAMPKARVLIGGLGLGFSLKRALDFAAQDAEVHVAELLPEVVDWNRDLLRGVNGLLLNDKRVKVLIEDVFETIRRAEKRSYDAILLDVDNGPTSFVQPKNARIYDKHGFGLIRRALKQTGRVSFWSATDEPDFVRHLSRAGFTVRTVQAKANKHAKRAAHRIYVGDFTPRHFSPAASRPQRD